MAPTITSALPNAAVDQTYSTSLSATGGTSSYSWKLDDDSTLPPGLHISDRGTIAGTPTRAGSFAFTVSVTDSATPPTVATSTLSLVVDPGGPWWKRWPAELGQVTFWLALLALGLPLIGAVWIFRFTTTPKYVAVGMLTGLAALVSGCLIGFLFGVPRVVSSGQLRQQSDAPAYTPSSNLAEVSDWLTKLLLGAGLVQLTHLGGPIGTLINSVALGLAPAIGGVPGNSAKVMAGAILFTFVIAGFLDGFVVTTIWYQKRISQL